MNHSGHKKFVCSCGTVVSQCRCPSNDKEVQVIEKGCVRCRRAVVGAIPEAQISGNTLAESTRPRREITIVVTPLVVPDASPPLAAWQVSVETEKTEWRETFGSRDSLDAFIRGVRAGAAARGCFDIEVVE